MRARGYLRHVAAALVAAVGPGFASTAGAASFDYLYVEANEGGSSGGHTAIALGEQTFHFQNRNGLLVLDRDVTRDFLHGYALVNNRTIYSSRVALGDSDRERIRATFARRYQAQSRQLDVLEAVHQLPEDCATRLAGEVRSEAEVFADPEPEVRIRLAVESKCVRLLEHSLVAIG